MELKRLSKEAIPAALAKAERYRLLNEPEEAESICLDILAVDADNREAVIVLLLALTDQFGKRSAVTVRDARALVARLQTAYDREYYAGLICERWAKAQIEADLPGHVTYQWLRAALQHYEQAEATAPVGNEDALLRWNTVVRVLAQNPALAPKEPEEEAPVDEPPV